MNEFRNSQNNPLQIGPGSSASVNDAVAVRVGPLLAGVPYVVTSSAPVHMVTGTATCVATANDLLVGGPDVQIAIEPVKHPLAGDLIYISALSPSGVYASMYVASRRGW